MITVRLARWPDDVAALRELDTTFVTERIYRTARTELSFQLVEERLPSPLQKRYEFQPDDPEARRDWDCAIVAESDGKLAGFAAAQYVAWNCRVVLWHLYVAPDFRRMGAGLQLLEAVDAFARSKQARCLWLETQNVNYPAIQFYRRCGFTLCGFDETLYNRDSSAQEETALFFARPVNACP